MEHVIAREPRARWPQEEFSGHTYAEPLSGLRVSWGSVLAGTVTILAVFLICWTLALGITSLFVRPTPNSLGNSAFVLWVCGIASALVGAFIGGWIAGYLPGNARRSIGLAHGFLAWCVAMLVCFGAHLVVLRGVVGTAANAIMSSGMAPDADVAAATRAIIGYAQWFGWSWFGTWLVAGAFALIGAAFGVRRIAGGPRAPSPPREREEPVTVREPPFGSPVTPAT